MPSPLSSHVSSGSSSSRELAAVIELTWLFSCSSEEIGELAPRLGRALALPRWRLCGCAGARRRRMAYSRPERERGLDGDHRRVKLSCRDNTHARRHKHTSEEPKLHVLLAHVLDRIYGVRCVSRLSATSARSTASTGRCSLRILTLTCGQSSPMSVTKNWYVIGSSLDRRTKRATSLCGVRRGRMQRDNTLVSVSSSD